MFPDSYPPTLIDDATTTAVLGVELSHPGPDTVVVALIGEADLSTAPALRTALADVDVAGARRVIVDLDRLMFFDATTLDLLVEARTRVRATEGTLRVRCHNDLGRRILAAGGVEFLLESTNDVSVYA